MLERIASDFGTPCYVYDMDAVRVRAAEIRKAFGGRLALSYAVKANPNTTVIRRLAGVVDSLDISSGGELQRSLVAGWTPGLISFTGPGKTDDELRAAVEARIGVVIVESVAEAVRLSAIATEQEVEQPILIRISPASIPAGFGVGMAGKACQFGIDEETSEVEVAAIIKLLNLPLIGFHIYAGTQCLKAEAVAENYENFIRIFRHLCERFDICPQHLVFGSGLGVPYYINDRPVDLAAISAVTNPRLDELKADARFANTKLSLELGRYLIGEAGSYLTSVIHIKHSRGTDVAVCDGGMNHHLAACGLMGSVIPRNYRMSKLGGAGEPRKYDAYGPLCTTIDRLARSVELPQLSVGDVIAVECSGAYGLTASPVHFISHTLPKEIIIETIDGMVKIENISEPHS